MPKGRPEAYSTEITRTSEHPGMPGRWVNYPTLDPDTGMVLPERDAFLRAMKLGLFGDGFASNDEAVESARKRSGLITEAYKRGGMEESIRFRSETPFNPAGAKPGDVGSVVRELIVAPKANGPKLLNGER